MRVVGIEVEREEVADFQKVFPGSKAAILLERIMQKEEMVWEGVLHEGSSSMEQVRRAQGALSALDDIAKMANEVIKASLEEEDKPETEGEEEDERPEFY